MVKQLALAFVEWQQNSPVGRTIDFAVNLSFLVVVLCYAFSEGGGGFFWPALSALLAVCLTFDLIRIIRVTPKKLPNP